ncbi:MAG: hypothetical protein KBS52_00520 [Clostridiales bacterium]|nr:hypothetical protein [Candidatus Equinaster intestinalis]
MIRREAQIERKKAEIAEHFKKEKRKAVIIWIIFEVVAVALSFIITKSVFDEKFLQWFLVSLFFLVVFPITVLSKKLKTLSKQETTQKQFAEHE